MEEDDDDDEAGEVSYLGILAAAKLAKGKHDPAYIEAVTKLAEAQEARRREARLAHVSVRKATAKVEGLERQTQRLAVAVEDATTALEKAQAARADR